MILALLTLLLALIAVAGTALFAFGLLHTGPGLGVGYLAWAAVMSTTAILGARKH